MTENRSARRSVTAALALATLALAGCSSSGGGLDLSGTGAPTSSAPARTPASTPPSATAASVPPGSTGAAGSAPGSGGASPDSAAATPLLLTAAEVGGTFARTSSDTQDTPLPCTPNQPGPLTQVPPSSAAQTDFATPEGTVTITERVVLYPDAASAGRVVTAVRAGFSCPSADAGGATLQIAGPNDVTSVVGANVDAADDWQLRSEAGEAELVVVRIGEKVVQLVFTAAPGASIQIDSAQLLRTAVAKAINGG